MIRKRRNISRTFFDGFMLAVSMIILLGLLFAPEKNIEKK